MVAKPRVKLSRKTVLSITMSQNQVFLLADATSKLVMTSGCTSNKTVHWLSAKVRADHGYLKYFDKNGIQVKGKTVVEDGKTYYYDAHSGALVTSSFAEIAPNQWSYFNTDGQALKGKWTINGKEYYFDQNGIQYKGKAVKVGSRYKYYDGKRWSTCNQPLRSNRA